jgi:hypothetical protein
MPNDILKKLGLVGKDLQEFSLDTVKLTFECNRFDFDYELLIKLVRKGYNPVEIPVNYNARSFEAGKKVSVTRDPWTWLRALVKYRLVKIDPLRLINKKS